MEAYELDKNKIIDWAVNIADYDELETVSKALYGLYAERRKSEQPEAHKRARQYVKQSGNVKAEQYKPRKPKDSNYWRYKKKSAPKEEYNGRHGQVRIIKGKTQHVSELV